jgi:AcrR family transcriptional regulator
MSTDAVRNGTMDERARRIVETAIALAERDGFAAVRLRDVAAAADVALGTVYKRFSSKEEILLAALEQEAERLASKLGKKAPPGDTAAARVDFLFQAITRGMCRRPTLAKAQIRSIVSGDPHITDRVASFHAMITAIVVAAIKNEAAESATSVWGGDADRTEREVAIVLQHVWFSSMVGWAGGLHDVNHVIELLEVTSRRMLGDTK